MKTFSMFVMLLGLGAFSLGCGAQDSATGDGGADAAATSPDAGGEATDEHGDHDHDAEEADHDDADHDEADHDHGEEGHDEDGEEAEAEAAAEGTEN